MGSEGGGEGRRRVSEWGFFFFKQETAYEMLRGGVGSEVGIGDGVCLSVCLCVCESVCLSMCVHYFLRACVCLCRRGISRSLQA